MSSSEQNYTKWREKCLIFAQRRKEGYDIESKKSIEEDEIMVTVTILNK